MYTGYISKNKITKRNRGFCTNNCVVVSQMIQSFCPRLQIRKYLRHMIVKWLLHQKNIKWSKTILLRTMLFNNNIINTQTQIFQSERLHSIEKAWSESQKPRQRVSNADRKVFANPESFCDKFIIGWRISGYFALQNIQIICKVSGWTGKFPDNLKSVRII